MAAIFRGHAPAITPDFRPKPTSKNNSSGKRSVTFGTLKTPQNTTNNTNMDATNNNNNNNISEEDRKKEAERNETIRQYAQYRSAPDQFPSYDRLRFVRLPQGWLPEGLRDTAPSSNNNNSATVAKGTEAADAQVNNNTTQPPQLQHWPCLVYQNLAELVRDLSPDSSKRLKAKFIVEHRKAPQMVVARLLGWDNDSVNMGGASSWKNGQSDKKGAPVDNNKKIKMKNRFAEPRIELIKLSGYTLEEHDEGSRANDGELLSFVDSQLEFENVCEELIASHVANTKASGSSGDNGVVDVNVARHAYQFRNAVDMALNCLALDVGSDPLPIREDNDFVFNTPKLSSGAPSSSTKKKKKNEHAGSAKKEDLGAAVNRSSEDAAAVEESKETVVSEKKSVAEKAKAQSLKRNPANQKSDKSEEKPKPQEQAASSAEGKNEIPPLKHNLDPNESWSDAWKKMRDSGWTWKVGSGLMTDYYYIKPGCKIKGGVKDQDYFESESDAKAYATKNYGWKSEIAVKEEKLFGGRTKVKATTAEEKKPATDKSSRTKAKTAESKKKASSSSIEKENNSNTLVGTKSRPTSGTQAVPLKFQSSKKHRGRLDKIMSASKSKASSMAPVAEIVAEKKEEETPWKEVWDAMKRSGWGWRGGSGLMTDYYYIKPECKIKGGTVGQDYFISVKDVQTYARNIYKWGVVSHEKLMATIEEYAKYSGEVVPPQAEGQEIKVNESWGDAWKKMLKSGWSWKAGSGLMMDYFYIKPGCKIKGSVEGQDYFTSLGDVQKFASRNYGWVGDEDGISEDNVEAAGDNNEEVGRGKRRSAARLGEDEEPKKEKRQKIEKKKKEQEEMTLAKEESEDEPPSSDDEEDELSSDEEDYDDIRSTFSETGFQTKKLFLAEVADENVPFLKSDLDPSESWSDAWKKMRDSGWTWKTGSGLMTDYYYIKPGCKTKGGVKGQDYFESVDDVKAFAMRNYGWRGEEVPVNESNIGRKRSNSTTDRDKKPAAKEQQNKRPKVEKTLSKTMQDVHKSFKVKSTTKKAAPSEPKPLTYTEKKARWQQMQSDGWKVMKAGRYNALHDWYYIRPNCDPGDANCKLGVDYFLCEDDAIESVKASSTTAAPKTAKKTKSSNELVDDSLQTPADCRTQPQDPAIPLLSSPESDSSTTSSELYEWNNVWDLLQRAGWKVMKAGKYNPLHDWYYVRPNRDPGDSQCVLGRHYFTSQNEVIEFVKSVDEKQSSGKKGKATRKSMGVMLNAFEEAGQEEEAESA